MGSWSRKASGPNGFPMFFVREFWEVLKHDILDLVKEVGEGRARLDTINYFQIALIPKKDATTIVGDCRPIVLLNSSFKIISKILTNTLVPVIGHMMGDY